MANTFLVVVTGANRGIGYAICEKILEQSSSKPLILYATSRAGSDLKLSPKDKQRIVYRPLDISDVRSVQSFADEVKQAGIPLDVLINNAGINLDDDFSYENAKKTIDVNYHGTLAICQTLLTQIRPASGRIVNLSSTGSSLRPFSQSLQHRFRNTQTLSALDAIMKEYEEAVLQGNDSSLGFPTMRSYGVSKAAVNVLTKILAQENEGILINCCCPGWVKTDMGNQVGSAPKTPEEGARIPVKLAIGDIGNVSGQYWANGSVTSTADGIVQEW